MGFTSISENLHPHNINTNNGNESVEYLNLNPTKNLPNSIEISILTIDDQESLKQSVSIYPNPVKSNTMFVKTNRDLDVQIYDVLGKKVASKRISKTNNKIDVSNLNKGIYLIKLSSGTETVTKKLVRQ